MKFDVVTLDNKKEGSIELSDFVFGLTPRKDILARVVNWQLAKRRAGTHSTKTISEISGTTKKPFAQKGTGRARRGDKKSPVLVGGGTIFGPKPRDYSYSIPKKAKRLAMRTILSMKAKSDRLMVIEDFTIADGKTKKLAEILKKLSLNERTVIVLKDDDVMLRRAGRNIKNLSFLTYNRLRAHDLFYGRKIVLLETSVKKLSEFYADGKEA